MKHLEIVNLSGKLSNWTMSTIYFAFLHWTLWHFLFRLCRQCFSLFQGLRASKFGQFVFLNTSMGARSPGIFLYPKGNIFRKTTREVDHEEFTISSKHFPTFLAFTPHLQSHIHFCKSISTQNSDHQQKVSQITTKGQEWSLSRQFFESKQN